MKGKTAYRTAEREAYEEAGLMGRIGKAPVGSYGYDKRLACGSTVACEVVVFPLEVTRSCLRWPEMEERERQWFSPEAAANIVAESGLRNILLGVCR
jgi:8-oxo-dGTP pyrophosphatase MutT (NUDIX family)